MDIATLQNKLKHTNLNNLSYLKLINFGEYAEFATIYFDPLKFQKVLQCFPKIQYYHFRKVYASIMNVSDGVLMRIFVNLRGLAWNGCHISSRNRLLDLFSKRVNGLLFNQEIEIDKSTKFKNLRELIVHQPPMRPLQHILSTTGGLEHIHLDEIMSNDQKKEWRELVQTIMIKHTKLKWLSIHVDFELFDDVCSGIESGLLKAEERHDIKLKIYVNCGDNDQCVSMKNILKIIHLLGSLTKEFMVHVAVRGRRDVKLLESDIERIRSYQNVNVYAENDCMIVTNKQCTMDGFCGSFQMYPNLIF